MHIMFVFTCMFTVTTKTLTIREEIYDKLCRLKREDETLSDLLDRLTSNVSTIELLKQQMAGTIEFEDADTLKEEIRRKRALGMG